MKERYGLIGLPVGHSHSARIHERLGGYEYGLWPLEADALASFLDARDFDGINVTMPYKSAVIEHLDVVDQLAARLGAVNTIVRRGDSLFGFNTDVDGFRALLQSVAPTVREQKVLILGTGATSRTARLVLEEAGAHPIWNVSREPGDEASVITYDETSAHRDAQWIVNTTPVGMGEHFDEAPIDLQAFPALRGVIDVIYNPLATPLLQQARALRIPHANGLRMLVFQAAKAMEHFTGERIDVSEAENTLCALTEETENVVLIGMPGVGKSTVGRLLGRSLGRRFVDLDAEIVKETGHSIPELFAQGGEAVFRDAETRALQKVARESGIVLSTGGGAVLREANRRLLRANGRLYFLDRPLETLEPSEDRPLAPSREKLAALYAERLPLYRDAADVIVSGYREAMEAVGIIRRDRKRRQRKDRS
ncbi:MAG: shikimate kinase [Peptoniphilaceae bacterium]|nr:shikimate kinase [Peptoniphilaceae bacterium]MDY6086291.1 shikimate kinase [Peptoniphilaceae bacterium]